MDPDPDCVAFRELLGQAERNPAIAAELTRLMLAGAPLREVLALAAPGPAANLKISGRFDVMASSHPSG